MNIFNKIISIFTGKQEKNKSAHLEHHIVNALNYDSDAYILTDIHGVIYYFNQTSHALFSNIEHGLSVFTLIRTPNFKTHFDILNTQQKNSLECEISIRTPHEHVFKAYFMNGTGYILLRLTDITLNNKAQKMHGDFIANVSHELRTPLASICGFIETLQGPAKGDIDAAEQFLGIMNAQAKRMNHLINGLLSLSRIEMDQYIMPNTPCDVIKILDDVSLAMRPLLSNKNMTLIKLYDVPDAMIYGDTGQIFQVFQNLVENAIKYSPTDTDITLNCVLQDDFWHISVTDMGVGIPENHIPRLVERFYRIDDARHRSQGGAGLGLSIVSKIIDRHKGRLEIQSTTDSEANSHKNKGSSFHVFLPVLTPSHS